MNTQVEYRRPGRNRYGEYKSHTQLDHNGVVGHITIYLVWFISLGWYYTIELQGWNYKESRHGYKVILDFSKDKTMWRNGKELPLCAAAAEVEAKEMCAKYGITGVEFAPYTLSRQPKKLIRK